MESLGTQLYALGIVLLAGVSFGILFDLFRVIRGRLQPGLLSTLLLDLLFWIFVCPILVFYLLLANWGELRGYVFIGLFLGIFVYGLLFSKIVVAVLIWLLNALLAVVSFLLTSLLRLASLPFVVFAEVKMILPQRTSSRAWRLRSRLRWRK